MKIYRIISFLNTKSHFDFTAKEQNEYLEKLGIALDDIERSYKQYLCQRFFISRILNILQNFSCFIITPFIVIYYYLKGYFVKKGEIVECIGEFKDITEIVPEELNIQYSINLTYWFSGSMLSNYDIVYVLKILLRYPISPFFLLKNIIKIARYSYMIFVHEPKAIAVHNEYSFTSSILTNYCNSRRVKHINVMHGEKLAIIRDSYFRYDICYVWDEYYSKLFISQNAYKNQFVVALPISMKIKIDIPNPNFYADYKYYLSTITEEKLKKIISAMSFSKNERKSVKYRLHPRYSDVKLLEKFVCTENIEYPSKISIIDSLANCGCAVGCYSTVLNQAYSSGIPVLLDDVAEKKMFDKLKTYKYILIDKELPCLSEKQIKNFNN